VVLGVVLGLAGGHGRVASAHKNGIISGGSCNGCHTGGKIPTVTLSASPMNPAVGEAVTLTISVTQTNGPVAGFFLTTEFGHVGTFKAIEAGTAVNPVGVTHTLPRNGSGGVTTFNVEWSSSAATGVRFSVYALSANGDGSSSGDAGGEAVLNLACGCAGATYTLDQDEDGYGTTDPAYPTRLDCSKPTMYAAAGGDCDDFDPAVHPGASERCDGKDDNCDGQIDEGSGLALCGVATATCLRGVCSAGGPGGASGTGGSSGIGPAAGPGSGGGGGSVLGAGSGGRGGPGGSGVADLPGSGGDQSRDADAGVHDGGGGTVAPPTEVDPSRGCSIAPVGASSARTGVVAWLAGLWVLARRTRRTAVRRPGRGGGRRASV